MKEFTCVACPVGCRLTVSKKDDGTWKVQGFQCKRGLEYGLQEMTDARRNFSSTVRIKNGFLTLLPVKTSAPLPKDKIFAAMEIIRRTHTDAPIQVGDQIITDILHTGVDIIAARTIERS